MKNVVDFLIDSRKQVILKAVVTDYVRTAEPVGSHTLVERHQFGVRSATIRNELAELAELGYLQQPHTSAGRVPSDRGYRFYVDWLMDAASLDSRQADSARSRLNPHRSEVDIIIEQTCRILADLAQYTCMATSPAIRDAKIGHISVAEVGPDRLLAVVVLSNGRVLHELVEFDRKSKRIDPVRATNFLTGRLAGRELPTVCSGAMESVPDDAADMAELLGKVMQFLRREAEGDGETDIHLEGASYIMHQPEFKDVERLEAVLSLLDRRQALYSLFSSIYLGPDVTVIIGSENPIGEMRDCSFVASKYRISGRVAGSIGVLGPTRMDYPRAVSAVQFMARNLGELLTALSVA